MTAPAATEHAATLYAAQAATSAAVSGAIRALWRGFGLADVAGAWAAIREQVLAVVVAGQVRAAETAAAYQSAVLRDAGLEPLAPARIDPAGFAGYNGDGVPVLDVLDAVPVWMRADIAAGVPPELAAEKARYRAELLGYNETQRAADRAGFVGRTIEPRIVGFERYVNLPACGRCIILAGRRYRRDASFERHPDCDCTFVEVTEDDAGAGPENEPSALFRSMSREEQDRRFTKAGAQAIRSGADIGQVVNARKGARGLLPASARLTKDEAAALRNGLKRGRLEPVRLYGRDVFITTEGATVRGAAGKRLATTGAAAKQGGRYRQANTPRLMPESIAEIAGDDMDMYLHLLRRFAYIL